jgi:hypothetical protein
VTHAPPTRGSRAGGSPAAREYPDPVATALSTELSRLSKARAASEGRRTARRASLLLLAGLVVAALFHRMLVPLPGLSFLEAHPLWALLAVAAAVPAAWLVGRVVAAFARPTPRALARSLDDSLRLSDAVESGVSVEARGAPGPLDGLVADLAARRLAATDPAAIWPAFRGGRRAPILLALLALFLLWAPGVLGIGGKGGSGAGDSLGVGRRDDPSPDRGAAPTPQDADAWLAAHGKLVFDVPDPERAPFAWRATFALDADAPADVRGPVSVIVDGGEPSEPVGSLAVARGARGPTVLPFDPGSWEALANRLSPGTHRVRVRLSPADPFRAPLDSEEVEVVIPPPDPPKPPPPPPPPPKPEPDPPPPPPPQGGQPPPPPAPKTHDEVVTPLAREGETVKKDDALVAVKDPNAGTAPPQEIPLSQALLDFEKVVERAIRAERVLPQDEAFVRRYLEALRKTVSPR